MSVRAHVIREPSGTKESSRIRIQIIWSWSGGSDLYLNIIDPPIPLFKPELFSSFLNFAMKHWDNDKKLVIHCNQGELRAPSLALLFLARTLAVIDDSSYSSASSEFQKCYPLYFPGEGIQAYFTQNWAKFGQDF